MICLATVLAVAIGCDVAADLSGDVRVIDGDTLQVGDTRVRLFGIDAPETQQTCIGADGSNWACGAWVSREVAAMLAGRSVHCEALDRDRYGRVVARCRTGGADVGRVLVQRGLAFAYRRYSLAYIGDEAAAADRGIGLHASVMVPPDQFRRERTAAAPPAPDPACRLKGNISSNGTRIFHSPGQRDYARTRINPAKGERWFCSDLEARRAGWRAARR